VTAHDGFTVADLTAYNEKHNEANGEENRDGETDNRSWNCGSEGPTDDPAIDDLRARQRRNVIGTLLLSAGIPMLLGGDEIARTQQGNNNAYCQDDEISWYDWENADQDLLAFTRTALALRHAHPALRPREYLRGPGGAPAQMVLYRADGQQMSEEDWQVPHAKTLAISLDGRQIEDAEGETDRARFLLLLNAHCEPVKFTIPVGRTTWQVVLTSVEPDDTPPVGDGGVIEVADRSFLLLLAR
jgi:isoamylase